jgi:hypothetical protein
VLLQCLYHTIAVGYLHAHHPTRAKKISGTPLSNNLTRNASKNGNEAYKTQNKFLGMPCDLPNNQQAVTSSASSAAHGA